ncbi:tetratricopeptide repeat protein [Archangium lipolyticum]|uniref:tetratricopeptide repeat protein n=1 Tax=Archangium lipolyticum TaxID=2970465 RepID=UPI00214A1779|nr:tetratricopeptide repeat protein [Archangium lipolyticum]
MSSIRSLSERFVLPVLVALSLAVSPLSAHAADLNTGADKEAKARAMFAQGNVSYDLAEFNKALDAYSEAYRLMPLPGFLFNIAQCHRQLGNPERAAFFYRRYLALSKGEPRNAELVRELLAEMDAAARNKEQERRMAREATAKDQAKAAALKAQAETTAARRVQDSERKRVLVPRASPAQARTEVKGESLTKKWWVWAGAGAVALIAGGTIAYVATAPQPRSTTLGTVH